MDKQLVLSIVVVVSVILLFGYLMQSIAAFIKASGNSLLGKIFSVENFIDTWGIVAMIFFVPFVVSIAASFVELLNSNTDDQFYAFLIVSMLLIFITLEFSQIGALNKNNKDWNILLVVAIFLDVASVVLVTAVKFTAVEALAFVFSIGLFAFLSSFMIILFAYVAGNRNAE